MTVRLKDFWIPFLMILLVSECTSQVRRELKTVNGAGSGRYQEGAIVHITAAVPKTGWIFEKWSGGQGTIADVYEDSTHLVMPAKSLTVKAVYRDRWSCGIGDIDRIRRELRKTPTTDRNARSRRAALYRWWRFLWRQGTEMHSFDGIADRLVNFDDDSPEGREAIDRGFASLESLHAHPVFIPEITGVSEDRPAEPAPRTDWPLYHGTEGSQRGFSPDAGPSVGRLAWRFPKGYRWDARPVLDGGRVFIASPGTDVIGFCLDEKTGEVVWKARQYGIQMYGTQGAKYDPLVTDDRVILVTGSQQTSVFVMEKKTGEPVRAAGRASSRAPGLSPKDAAVYQSHGKNVVLMDCRTGNKTWSFQAGTFLSGDPVLSGNRIYAADVDGSVYCFGLKSSEPVWHTHIGAEICGTPGVGHARIYLGDKIGKLHALDSSQGNEIWSYQADDFEERAHRFFSGALEVRGRVYAGAASGCVYCLDAGTGSLVWKCSVGDWIRSRPLMLDGVLYVATLDGRLAAIQDCGDHGKKIWQVRLNEHGFTADLAGSRRGILASGRDLILYSVSPATGFIQWRHGILDGAWVNGQFHAADWTGGLQPSPVVADGIVYVGGADGFVNALDAETGIELWRFETTGSVSAAPAVAEGKVFFGEIDGFDEFFAVDRITGNPIWRSREYGTVWVSAAYSNHRLFFGDTDGIMYAVDPDSGKCLWRYDTARDTPKENLPEGTPHRHGYPPGVYSNPASDGTTVYTGSWAGYYLALDQITGRLLWRTQTNDGNPEGGLPDSAAPVLWRDHLYVQKLGSVLAALRRTDGKIEWEWRAPPGFLQNGTVAAHDGRIFGSAVRAVTSLPYCARLYAFRDVAHGGEKIWEYRGGGGLTAPVVTKDKVIVGSSADVFITCIRPEDGKVLWRLYTGDQMLENVPALYGDKVYAHSKNGWLNAVR